jgi:hypothetical protein
MTDRIMNPVVTPSDTFTVLMRVNFDSVDVKGRRESALLSIHGAIHCITQFLEKTGLRAKTARWVKESNVDVNACPVNFSNQLLLGGRVNFETGG